ncbi:EAL domain-containing protein [Pseudoalteromonas xiamenensis]
MKTLKLKNIPNLWLIVGAILFISSLVAYVYISYQTTREEIMSEVDARLLHAARTVPLILGRDYHDKLNQLTDEDYQAASNKLSELAKALDMTYVYTMIYDPPSVRFTASSFTEYDHKIGRISRFKETYAEATAVNVQAFSSTTPLFEVAHDRWGSFKSVFVPYIAPSGQAYIAGADIALADLEAQLQQSARQAILTASFFFFIAALVGFLYFVTYRRTLEYDPSTGFPARVALMTKLRRKQHLHWSLAVIWVKDLEDIIGFYGIKVAEDVMQKLMDFFASRTAPHSVFRLATGKCAILFEEGDESQLVDLIRSFPVYSPIISNPHVCIHLHAGIATGNAQMVLENAYVACRQAKQQGELLRVYSYENLSGHLDHKNHLLLTNSIHRAIQSQHIQPFYEPRCEPHSNLINQIACTARIFNEFGQLLVAQRLDPILFNSGLSSQLCQILLKRCIERFRKESVHWSIVVPFSAMCDPHFLDLLKGELRRYPTPHRITFEVDEQDLLSNYSVVAAFITQVKAKGVKVLINHVSSGLITVTRVIRLDIDAIMLAPHITEHVCDDCHVAEYVHHMAVQCDVAKVKLCAMDVESAEQYDKLVELGVHSLQGRFVGASSPQVPQQLLKHPRQASA